MNKKKLVFFLVLTFLTNCSFDSKTGIWDGSKDEKERLAELEKQENSKISSDKIYSSDNTYSEEKILNEKVNLSNPINNISWLMHGLNHQNNLGNLNLPGVNNKFLNKKIGKNKFSLSKIMSSPLAYKNNILLTDEKGTIFSINQDGSINWKKNIYKKIYKRIYKNITFAVNENTIYVADNIGFIYAISFNTGKLIWLKNHGIPLKSKIKVFKKKIYLINQDNRLLCLNSKDGSVLWDVRTISSFIKSQNLLSLALSKKGDLVASNSSGDLLKANLNNGNVSWSINTLGSMLAHDTDFFKSSDIVIKDESIFFSTRTSIFSINLKNGFTNWEKNINSISAPIVDNENVFIVSENGFFVILDQQKGRIISSTNILKILKKKKQLTKVTGFIMGSGKIYAVTLNGYLIVSSATTGKVEKFVKIGDPIRSAPIINNGKLFIYTKNSRIIGFS